MKKFIFAIISFFLYGGAAYSQLYTGSYSHIFLSHEPNARAEAMGRGNAALTGDAYNIFDNPASTSFIENANISYTRLNPNVDSDLETSCDLYGAAYNSGKYGALGFTALDYYYESTIQNRDWHTRLYLLNYSYKFHNDISVGVNGGFLEEDFEPWYNSTYLLDIGFLKRFLLSHDEAAQNAFLAVSVNNILNSSINNVFGNTTYLPCILHIAGTYNISYNPGQSKLMPLSVTICAEYQDVLTNQYFTKVKFGGEVGIFEIVKLRAGHFDEFLQENEYYYEASGNISELTYGFGLAFPVYKFYNAIPLELNIDYAKLTNPHYSPSIDHDYRIFTIGLKSKF